MQGRGRLIPRELQSIPRELRSLLPLASPLPSKSSSSPEPLAASRASRRRRVLCCCLPPLSFSVRMNLCCDSVNLKFSFNFCSTGNYANDSVQGKSRTREEVERRRTTAKESWNWSREELEHGGIEPAWQNSGCGTEEGSETSCSGNGAFEQWRRRPWWGRRL
ncbi:hypothetical protein Ahy_A04g017367 isoform C [Arachis hypogaea]|uniref:Uncharacterized protein n=1 Tax=Arachis hypogaea TaxID=3818 RepID=A0A445DAV1_ARAHY|nr:hypothetical protein Ahy_A04g017367 isoform C [Arachis hypogaea]